MYLLVCASGRISWCGFRMERPLSVDNFSFLKIAWEGGHGVHRSHQHQPSASATHVLAAIHTTAIFLPSEGKKSGSCCHKKSPVTIILVRTPSSSNFIFMQFGCLLTAPKRKKLKIPNFQFLLNEGCPGVVLQLL